MKKSPKSLIAMILILVFAVVLLPEIKNDFGFGKSYAAENSIKFTTTATESDTMVYPTPATTTAESTDTVVTTTAYATSGQCGDNLTWEFDESTGTLTISGTGDMWDYNCYPYTARIKTVVVEEGVTSIGNYAFSSCFNITDATISNSVTTIGDYAFWKTPELKQINIPSSVTSIGECAFGGCTDMTKIIVDKDNKHYINDSSYALYDIDKTKLIQYPCGNMKSNYKIPDGVTTICVCAFAYNDVQNILIPDSVETIESGAFYGVSLQNIYYTGTEKDWDNISINIENNDILSKVKVRFNASESDMTEPTTVHTTEVSSQTSPTSGQCGDNLTWEFDKSTGTLTISGTGDMWDYGTIFVPWDNYRSSLRSVSLPDGLTSIGVDAFTNSENLKNVTIPDGVTIIGQNAFHGCSSLTSVNIPDSVTSIGSSAFHGCSSLTSVNIPDSVTSIGSSPFHNCRSLTNITVDSANPVYSSDENGVLFDKDKTNLIAYPAGNPKTSYVIPESVLGIEPYAFVANQHLESVTIGDNVYSLGYHSFSICESLKSVTIGSNAGIGVNEPFLGCVNLTNITVDSANPSSSSDEYGVLFNKDKTELLQYPLGNTRTSYEIPDSVSKICFASFDQSTFLETVTIPDSVTDISDNAFSNSKNLKHITIPGSVKNIGEFVFSDCPKLSSVSISDGVVSIERCAFLYCNSLKSITISDSVTSIGESAFGDCYSLKYIHLPASVTEIGKDILRGTSAYICAETEDCYAKTYAEEHGIEFQVCNGIHLENLPEIITDKCGDNLTWTLNTVKGTLTISGTGDMWEFDGETPWYPYRSLIESVVVEEGATSICNRAFAWCSNIETATLPDSLVTIGGYAFMGCENLETLTLGKGIETIGEGGISLCRNLKNIRMYEGVTSVGDWAFAYNDSLEYVHFPKSVTEIGENIFDTISPYICAETKNCYAKTYTDENGIEFRLCADHREVPDVNDKSCGENLTWSLDIETGVLTISGTGDMYDYSVSEAAPWYSHQPYIKSVVINDGVTSIGDYAFTDLPNLTKVTMADTVLTIGHYAFEDCIGLKDAEISKNAVSIGADAFDNCNSLTSVIIPDSVTKVSIYAFSSCDALESVIIGDGLEEISSHCFYNCSKLEYIEIGNNVTKIGSNAFTLCSDLKTVVLPKTLESIAAYAFDYCNKLSSVYYEGTWEEWCEITFGYYNSDLLNASIYCNASAEDVPDDGTNPDSPEYNFEWNLNKSTGTLYIYGSGPMKNYSGAVAPWYIYQSQIKEVIIEEGITTVGDYAFNDFPGIISVSLPQSIVSIGDYAFEKCKNLEYINIGNKVKSIGDFAFSNCDSLSNLTIPGSVTVFGAYTFSNSGIRNLTFERGLKNIGSTAFESCHDIRKLIIGEDVEKIDSQAFWNCLNLKTVYIPLSVKNICESAFNNCHDITDVYYEGSEEDWEAITFGYNNSSILRATIHFGASADDIPEDETTIYYPTTTAPLITDPEDGRLDPTTTTKPTTIYPESTTAHEVTGKFIFRVYGYGHGVGMSQHGALEMAANGDSYETILTHYYPGTTIKTDDSTPVTIKYGGVDIPLVEYLCKTTKSEMGFSSAGKEALKAQMATIYTYAKHNGFVVKRSQHAYNDNFSYEGTKIHEACLEYLGISSDFETPVAKYVDYNGKAANTVCFASSAGKTASASSVWKVDSYPYLNGGVSSPETVDITTKEITAAEMKKYIESYAKDNDVQITLSDNPAEWLEILSHDSAYSSDIGYITEIRVGNTVIKGNAFRCYVLDFVIKSHCFIFEYRPEEETTTYYPTTTGVAYPNTETTLANTTGKYPSTTASLTTNATTAEAVVTLKPGQTVIDEGTTKAPTTKKPSTTKVPATTTTTKPAEDVHTHTAQLVVVPASCTVNGMKYTVCRECGEPMGEITIVVAEGHKAGEWITVLEATTESVGKQIRNCILCGEKVDEREIPKLSTVIDEKTGISIDYSAEDYDGEVEITVKETFDGTAFDIVDTSLASTQKFICDIVMTVDGNETQPEGKVTVRIPLPDGYDYTRTFVYHVDTVTGNLEKMQAKYVDGYLVFETTHFSYYAVVEELAVEIRNPSAKVIEYGDAIVLHADFEGDLPKGWKIRWTASNDNFSYSVSSDGKTCTVSPEKNGDTTFTATVYNSNGKEISKDEQIMTSKAGIFQKIIAFFKKLFGLTKTIPQIYKGIY